MEPGVPPAGMAGRIRSEYSADGCVRQVLFKTSTVIDVMVYAMEASSQMAFSAWKKRRRIKDARTDMAIEVLRTRMHLIPSDALQDPLLEGVQTLPFLGQMTGLQYFTHRCGLQDAANMTCMFHLLAFPGSVVALHGDRAATPHTGSWNRR